MVEAPRSATTAMAPRLAQEVVDYRSPTVGLIIGNCKGSLRRSTITSSASIISHATTAASFALPWRAAIVERPKYSAYNTSAIFSVAMWRVPLHGNPG
jgi:hypothetical protein